MKAGVDEFVEAELPAPKEKPLLEGADDVGAPKGDVGAGFDTGRAGFDSSAGDGDLLAPKLNGDEAV